MSSWLVAPHDVTKLLMLALRCKHQNFSLPTSSSYHAESDHVPGITPHHAIFRSADTHTLSQWKWCNKPIVNPKKSVNAKNIYSIAKTIILNIAMSLCVLKAVECTLTPPEGITILEFNKFNFGGLKMNKEKVKGLLIFVLKQCFTTREEKQFSEFFWTWNYFFLSLQHKTVLTIPSIWAFLYTTQSNTPQFGKTKTHFCFIFTL